MKWVMTFNYIAVPYCMTIPLFINCGHGIYEGRQNKWKSREKQHCARTKCTGPVVPLLLTRPHIFWSSVNVVCVRWEIVYSVTTSLTLKRKCLRSSSYFPYLEAFLEWDMDQAHINLVLCNFQIHHVKNFPKTFAKVVFFKFLNKHNFEFSISAY